jgi:hypothetical protein
MPSRSIRGSVLAAAAQGAALPSAAHRMDPNTLANILATAYGARYVSEQMSRCTARGVQCECELRHDGRDGYEPLELVLDRSSGTPYLTVVVRDTARMVFNVGQVKCMRITTVRRP